MLRIVDYSHLETGAVEGDVLVCDGGDLTLTGDVNGTLTVATGGYARVCGTVSSLVVRDAGAVRLEGVCSGAVRNDGGELTMTSGALVDGPVYGSVTTV